MTFEPSIFNNNSYNQNYSNYNNNYNNNKHTPYYGNNIENTQTSTKNTNQYGSNFNNPYIQKTQINQINQINNNKINQNYNNINQRNTNKTGVDPEFKILITPYIFDLIYSIIFQNQNIDFYGVFYGSVKDKTHFKINDNDKSNKTIKSFLIIEAVDFIFDKGLLSLVNIESTMKESYKKIMSNFKDIYPLGVFSTRTESEAVPSFADQTVFINFELLKYNKLETEKFPNIYGCFSTDFSSNSLNIDDIVSHKLQSRLFIFVNNNQEELKPLPFEIINLKETTYKYDSFICGNTFTNEIQNLNSHLFEEIKTNNNKAISNLQEIINNSSKVINDEKPKNKSSKIDIIGLRKQLNQRKITYESLVNEIYSNIIK